MALYAVIVIAPPGLIFAIRLAADALCFFAGSTHSAPIYIHIIIGIRIITILVVLIIRRGIVHGVSVNGGGASVGSVGVVSVRGVGITGRAVGSISVPGIRGSVGAVCGVPVGGVGIAIGAIGGVSIRGVGSAVAVIHCVSILGHRSGVSKCGGHAECQTA